MKRKTITKKKVTKQSLLNKMILMERSHLTENTLRKINSDKETITTKMERACLQKTNTGSERWPIREDYSEIGIFRNMKFDGEKVSKKLCEYFKGEGLEAQVIECSIYYKNKTEAKKDGITDYALPGDKIPKFSILKGIFYRLLIESPLQSCGDHK